MAASSHTPISAIKLGMLVKVKSIMFMKQIVPGSYKTIRVGGKIASVEQVKNVPIDAGDMFCIVDVVDCNQRSYQRADKNRDYHGAIYEIRCLSIDNNLIYKRRVFEKIYVKTKNSAVFHYADNMFSTEEFQDIFHEKPFDELFEIVAQ